LRKRRGDRVTRIAGGAIGINGDLDRIERTGARLE